MSDVLTVEGLLGSSARSRDLPVDEGRAAFVLSGLEAGVPVERIALELGVSLAPRERLALRAFTSRTATRRAEVAAELGLPRNAVTRAWQGAFRRLIAPVRKCEACGAGLDVFSRRDRRFCDDRCRRACSV